MRSQLKIENPDRIEFTLTMTMSLSEWKELQGQLDGNYPSWKLSHQISSMVSQATGTFYPDEKAEAAPQQPKL